MKVLVTKDRWGVQIWKADAKITYSKHMHGKESIWTSDKLFKNQRALSNKFVAENFSDLGQDMVWGESREMILSLTKFGYLK